MARSNWRGTFVMRLSSEEKLAIDEKARSLDVTTSSLVRALACIPINSNKDLEPDGEPVFVVFDRASMARLSQSVSAYGSLYCQACRSFESIRRANAGETYLSEAFSNLGLNLEFVAGGVALVEGVARSLEDNAAAYFNRLREKELRSIAKSDCDAFISTRLSDSERIRVDENAKGIGVTASSLIRALARIPIELRKEGDDVSSPACLYFDFDAIPRLSGTINTYGTLFNQAAKSLNTLAKHGSRNAASLAATLSHVSMTLESVATGSLEIKDDARFIEGHELVYLETADGRSAQW